MANRVNSKPLMEPPQLTRPIPVYDTSKSVAQNMAGQGTPSANNIFAAMRTPTAQLQMQQPVRQPAAPTPQPQEQTKTQPAITNMDELAAAMGYTSPEEEERLRKASVANRRILAVADAIRHIGNIANTINYAPAQQFNSPVAEEQARYERGKAMRDKANLVYMNYQQAKAAQDAKQRQWEAEQQQKANQWNATFKYNAARDAARLAEQQRQADQTLAFNRQKQADAVERGKRQDAETARHHRATTGLGYANLKQRKAEFEYKKQNGGNGNSKPTSLRGTNGWYSKKMNSEESQAFYNQTYEEMKNRGLIKEDAVLAGLPADIFGNKSISLAAKKAAVDNALMEHPEVGDWLAEQFEFDFDPRYRESGTPMKPKANTPFQAPWSNNRGNPFEDRQPKGNSENNHKSNPFG